MRNLKISILIAAVLGLALASPLAAQQLHGISFLKGAITPVLVGDPYLASYKISNNVDECNDTLTISSLVDVVDAKAGPVNSGNILTSLTWVFSDGNNHMVGGTMVLPFGVSAKSNLYSFYTVAAGDFNLPGHILSDEAAITWTDNCDKGCGNCPLGNQTATSGSQSLVNAPKPCVSVKKTPDCDVAEVGKQIVYTIEIANCGPNPLTLVSVNDTLLGDITSQAQGNCGTIDVNSSCSFTVNRTILNTDPSPLENKVTVTYIDQFAQTTDANSSTSVTIIHPDYTVTKTCTSKPIPPGGPATFNVAIANTGDVPLSFTTNEAAESNVAEPFIVLAGKTKNLTISIPADGNNIVDTITVDANVNAANPLECPVPNIIKKSNPATCYVTPTIDVTKTPDCDVSMPGKVVIYTIKITNKGSNQLELVDVNDTLLGNLTAVAQSHGCGTLAGGASCSFTVQRTILAGDPNTLVNTVTVLYVDAQAQQASDIASASVTIIHPSFTVTKTCTSDPIPAGGPATFDVNVTNTGDVPLSFTTNEPNQSSLPEPFTVAAGVTQTLTITIPTSGTLDVLNSITVTASLVDEPNCIQFGPPDNQRSARDICYAPPQGITRTWGFWAQHCDFTTRVFKCCGSSINLGWVKIDSTAKLFGVFKMHNDKKACPAQSDLCRARIQASVQALAAILNGCMKGGAKLPIDEATIADTLKKCDIKAINDLGSLLGDFNESNDTGTALDCNGKSQGSASGSCAKTLGNCTVLGSPCNKTCP